MRKDITIILVSVSLVGLVVGYLAAATYLPQWFLGSSELVEVPSPGPVEEGELFERADQDQFAGQVRIDFSQDKTQVDQEVKAEIVIDTGGETINGFDIVAEFDTEEWSALTPEIDTSGSEAFVAYPRNEIVPQTGKIRFSGLTDLDSGFSGEMTIGSFLLRAKKPGKLEVKLVFNGKGVGDDTNLAKVSSGEDILVEVSHGMLEVK